jgi:CHAD domain-containing protein
LPGKLRDYCHHPGCNDAEGDVGNEALLHDLRKNSRRLRYKPTKFSVGILSQGIQ